MLLDHPKVVYKECVIINKWTYYHVSIPRLFCSFHESSFDPLWVHPQPFTTVGAHCAENNIIICLKWVSKGKKAPPEIELCHLFSSLFKLFASVFFWVNSSLMLCHSSSFLSNYMHIVGWLWFFCSLSVNKRVYGMQIKHFQQINANQH